MPMKKVCSPSQLPKGRFKQGDWKRKFVKFIWKKHIFLSHLENSRGPSSVKGSDVFTICSLCIVPKHILSFHCVSNWVESESSVTPKDVWEQFHFFGCVFASTKTDRPGQCKPLINDPWRNSYIYTHAVAKYRKTSTRRTPLLSPRVHLRWSQRPNFRLCVPLYRNLIPPAFTGWSEGVCVCVRGGGGVRGTPFFGLHGRCDRVYGFQDFLSLTN